MEDGVSLRRVGGEVETNVPRLVVHHSPTGFEFGYGGSGPADLSLNIVEWRLRVNSHFGFPERHEEVICWDGNAVYHVAWWLHSDFKWMFLAAIDGDTAFIPFSVIDEYIMKRMQISEDAHNGVYHDDL